ncbi:MAG TPA: 50S ribosomal protein L25, partial [Bacteroidetes bacterium]|nr:50S ribosomal protein L25 [Bacteroidota bacterium]
HYKGIAEGTKEGGALEILHHTLEISCLPKDIPDEIEIDVTNLKIGDSIHFREIELSEGVTSSMTEATTLVAVRAPKKEEVVEEVEAIEGATTEGEATEGEAETSEPDAAE